MLENIFIYEGEPGHEVVFVYDAEFRDKTLYDLPEVPVYESEIDVHTTAVWRSSEELIRSQTRLVPEGLADLVSRTKRTCR